MTDKAKRIWGSRPVPKGAEYFGVIKHPETREEGVLFLTPAWGFGRDGEIDSVEITEPIETLIARRTGQYTSEKKARALEENRKKRWPKK